jgi:hypothetical protein
MSAALQCDYRIHIDTVSWRVTGAFKHSAACDTILGHEWIRREVVRQEQEGRVVVGALMSEHENTGEIGVLQEFLVRHKQKRILPWNERLQQLVSSVLSSPSESEQRSQGVSAIFNTFVEHTRVSEQPALAGGRVLHGSGMNRGITDGGSSAGVPKAAHEGRISRPVDRAAS